MRPPIHTVLKCGAVLCILGMAGMERAGACIIPPPENYFENGDLDYKAMPPAWFPYEAYQLTGIKPATNTEGTFCNPTDIELKELESLLQASGKADAERSQILDAYRYLRNSMTKPTETSSCAQYHYSSNANRPNLSDLLPYEDFLKQLPDIVALYIRGARAYRNEDYESAAAFFEQVMSFPSSNGSVFSLSATYMLGMTQLRLKQLDESLATFELAEHLVAAGVKDPLGLTGAILGWKGKICYERRDFATAAKYYLDISASNDSKKQNTAFISLEWAFCKLDPYKYPEQIETVLADENLRKALIAWALSNPGDSCTMRKWLLPMLEEFADPQPFADRFAWLAYNSGDMEKARRWVKIAEPASVISMWINSKLFLYDGDMEKAIAALERVIETLEKNCNQTSQESPVWKKYDRSIGDPLGYIPFNPLEHARAELSALWVVKKPSSSAEYNNALKYLSKEDAAYVCAHMIPTNELFQYFKAYCSPNSNDNAIHCVDISDILGRRLIREGRMEESADVFMNGKEHSVRTLINSLREGRNTENSHGERVKNLMEAARITAEDGLYDDFWTGRYPNSVNDQSAPDISKTFLISDFSDKDAHGLQRKQWHYHLYLAADLMWEAAELLPDNDPLTAEALYRGGFSLKYLDPQAADKFYKALVRRNPNLAIAREADKRRWFPPEFTGKVLYTPLPKHFLTRARAKMLLPATAVVLAVAGAAGFLLVRRRRNTALPG